MSVNASKYQFIFLIHNHACTNAAIVFQSLWIIFVQIVYFPVIIAKIFIFQDVLRGPQSDM